MFGQRPKTCITTTRTCSHIRCMSYDVHRIRKLLHNLLVVLLLVRLYNRLLVGRVLDAAVDVAEGIEVVVASSQSVFCWQYSSLSALSSSMSALF